MLYWECTLHKYNQQVTGSGLFIAVTHLPDQQTFGLFYGCNDNMIKMLQSFGAILKNIQQKRKEKIAKLPSSQISKYCIFRTLFPHCIHADSTVCKLCDVWQSSALRVIQQSTLESVAEPRVQSPEQSVTGTAKARRCPSRAGATPQACPCFDQVL